mmetsp:Transcript_143295/g.457897  ORF Transcript_143295/g.457897 Transcript_143295/m.457897 type:complete len:331 (+) Transcript_143295:424-1416(+)
MMRRLWSERQYKRRWVPNQLQMRNTSGHRTTTHHLDDCAIIDSHRCSCSACHTTFHDVPLVELAPQCKAEDVIICLNSSIPSAPPPSCSSLTTRSRDNCGNFAAMLNWYSFSPRAFSNTLRRTLCSPSLAKREKTSHTAWSWVFRWNSCTSSINSEYAMRHEAPKPASSARCVRSAQGTPRDCRTTRSSIIAKMPVLPMSLASNALHSSARDSCGSLKAAARIAARSINWKCRIRSKDERIACAVGNGGSSMVMRALVGERDSTEDSTVNTSGCPAVLANCIQGNDSNCLAVGLKVGSLCKHSAMKCFASEETGRQILVGMKTKRAFWKE